jgi:hypothetical protein
MKLEILWESIKLPLRLVILAVIPVILNRLVGMPDLWAELLYVVLVTVDKYLHELWTLSEAKATGLYQVKDGTPVGLSPL